MLLSKYRVSGHSMIPTYHSGDTVLISSLPFLFTKPKIGYVIVFKKGDICLIKRVKKIVSQGLIVEGDNKKDSLKSSQMGVISPKLILGKVIIKL
jgi:nickel-type superoxide dismutase maturation protease